jgi:hypothetical protein
MGAQGHWAYNGRSFFSPKGTAMNSSPLALWTNRRHVHSRYDLLMALHHLLEGTELYAKAVSDAQQYDNPRLVEFFSQLEKTSRLQAEAARHLLEQHAPNLRLQD